MKYRKRLLKYKAYFQNVIFSQVKYIIFFIFHSQVLKFHCQGTELRVNITQQNVIFASRLK